MSLPYPYRPPAPIIVNEAVTKWAQQDLLNMAYLRSLSCRPDVRRAVESALSDPKLADPIQWGRLRYGWIRYKEPCEPPECILYGETQEEAARLFSQTTQPHYVLETAALVSRAQHLALNEQNDRLNDFELDRQYSIRNHW